MTLVIENNNVTLKWFFFTNQVVECSVTELISFLRRLSLDEKDNKIYLESKINYMTYQDRFTLHNAISHILQFVKDLYDCYCQVDEPHYTGEREVGNNDVHMISF